MGNMDSPIFILASSGNVLLLDSYTTDDIQYMYKSCNLVYNQRLAINEAEISKLLLHCAPITSNASMELAETLSWNNTKYVQHLSITKVNVTPSYYLYSPGDILNFTYNFMDIYGNIIRYNSSNAISIDLTRDTFSLTLKIEEDECFVCDVGVILYDVSLKDDIGDQYNMTITVKDNMLIAAESVMSLDIVGCYIRYGATSNKYQCQMCPFGKYNLFSNNSNECFQCNKSTTHISQCDGFYHFPG
eukprot:500396_1